jgi:hypothetical protein
MVQQCRKEQEAGVKVAVRESGKLKSGKEEMRGWEDAALWRANKAATERSGAASVAKLGGEGRRIEIMTIVSTLCFVIFVLGRLHAGPLRRCG